MGRPRKRQARAQKITADQVLTLLSGRDFFHSFTDDKHRREVWDAMGVFILPQWIKFFPCTRPAGWWEFESKEPRRCLNGPHPYESERPPIKMRANWFFCGFPNLRKSSEPGPEIYEREIDYLQRLKLLTPEEKRIAKTLCDKDQPRTLQEHFEQIKHTDYGPIMKALSFEP